MLRSESSSESFQCTAQLVQSQHIILTQAHHTRAAPGSLGDKTLLRQNIDRFTNGALRDAKRSPPYPFHDAGSWLECAADNLLTQALCKGVLHQWFIARNSLFCYSFYGI